MRIGIFGGTFDPPHISHTTILQCAIEQLQLDKVIVFPCGMPPHKQAYSSSSVRMDMAKLAFAHLPVIVDSYEIDHHGNSYTINTVKYVMDKYNVDNVTLIVGGDSFLKLDSWYDIANLLPLVGIAVVPRGDQLNAIRQLVDSYPCKTTILECICQPISSTTVRVRQQLCMSIDSMVSQNVIDYIDDNGIYSTYQTMAKSVRSGLSQYRYNHTYQVALLAVQLARQYGVDEDKALVAGLLHDCCKEYNVQQLQGYHIDREFPATTHSEVGALVAKEKYNIADVDILNAIRYHTTCRPNMSKLEKIIYIADKLEASRNYPTAHLYKDTLDETLLATMLEVNEIFLQHGEQPHPLFCKAINYYEKLLGERL